MDEIVARLGARRGQGWRLGAGAVIVAAVAAAVVLGRQQTAVVPCVGVGNASTVWNDDVRRRLEGALRSPGGQLAHDTAARVLTNTEAYVERWVTSYKTVCRATAVEGSQSEALLDVRMRCLFDRMTELSLLLSELRQPSGEAIQRAVGAIASVQAPETCETLQPSVADAPPEAVAAVVRDQRNLLLGARASLRLGRYEDAAAASRTALEVAESSSYPPLIAEAKLMLGQSEAQMGRYDRAETLLQEAHWTAEANHHDKIAAEAATELVFVLGELARTPDAALAWEPHARAAITRSEDDGSIEADLLAALGAARASKGDYDEALTLYEQCAEQRTRLYGETHVEVLSARGNIGNVLDYLGRSSEAQQILTGTVKQLEEALGGGHPEVARMLGNLAGVDVHVGDLEQARALFERAVEIKQTALGPEHPSLLATLDGLGVVCKNLGDDEAAIEHHQAALAIGEDSLGPTHPALGSVLINLAQVQLGREQHADARGSLERALTILREAHGERHPWVASAEMVLGAVALAEGKPDESYRRHAIARDIFVEVYGDASENVGLAESNLGRAGTGRMLARGARCTWSGRGRVWRGRAPDGAGPSSRDSGSSSSDEGKPCAAQETLTRAHALSTETAEEPDALTRARAACGRPG